MCFQLVGVSNSNILLRCWLDICVSYTRYIDNCSVKRSFYVKDNVATKES